METFICKRCGGGLDERGDYYVCPSCGARYTNDGARKYREELRNVLGEALYEEKQEQLSKLRRLLWKETHEKYSDGDAIKDICRKLRELVPDDAAAEFYYVVSDGKSKRINRFLQTFDMDKQPEYVEDFVRYMIRSLRKENVVFLHAFLEKARGKGILSRDTYQGLLDELEDEAEEIADGIYNVNLSRTAFVLYSSKDIDAVTELVYKLEKYGFTCFLAARNLQHGRNAVANYGPYLKTAIDNCRMVIFVSSKNSCDQACDALGLEMKYIRQKDIEGFPAECKNMPYQDAPMAYKKPRIEYLLGTQRESADKASGDIVKEFFGTLSYCQTEGAVIERINEILNEEPYQPVVKKSGGKADKNVKFCKTCGAENLLSAKFCMTCANEAFVDTREEFEDLLAQQLAKEAEEKSRVKKKKQKEAAALERQQAKEAAKEQKRREKESKRKRRREKARKGFNTLVTFALPLLLATALIVCGGYFENARHWLIGAGILVAYTAIYGKLIRIEEGLCWLFLGTQIALTVACITLYFINDITRTYATCFAASVFVSAFIIFIYLKKEDKETQLQDIAYTFIGIGGAALFIAIATWLTGLACTLTISVGVPTVYGLITCLHGIFVEDSEGWNWTFFWISIALGIASFVFCWINRDLTYFAVGMSLACGLYVFFKFDFYNLWRRGRIWGRSWSYWWLCWAIVFVVVTLRLFFGWWFTDFRVDKNGVLKGYYGKGGIVCIPEGVTSIDEEVFYNWWDNSDSMKEVVFPNSLQTIGSQAFKFRNSLTEIHIPDNVTTIEYEAFCECDKLKTVYLGSGLKTIGGSLFYNSPVETIYYNGTQEDWEKIEKIPYKLFFTPYEWDAGMGDYELVFLKE